jgi:tRNA1(Val) A37 N6-methylase TrmN6
VSLAESLASPDLKHLGAYYTNPDVAHFLVRWAVRSPADYVLDPSFGGGVFLRAACFHLKSLGGISKEQVYGVELDKGAFGKSIAGLKEWVAFSNLKLGDFFDFSAAGSTTTSSASIPRCDAVVGNPPFIRYQRFNGASRRNALRRAEEQGVVISQLASSWAPFVVHSASMLKSGGRLAMVLPYEILQAKYARPILQYVTSRFERTTILTFDVPLFPHLSEATVLLLAEGYGLGSEQTVSVRHYRSSRDLAIPISPVARTASMNVALMLSGEERASGLHLPKDDRDLYAGLRRIAMPLGGIAHVGIGYVTGANGFFHITPEVAREYDLPSKFLAPCVCRASAFRGGVFRKSDWRDALERGIAAYLLKLEGAELPDSVRRYLEVGESLLIHQGYKCRSRKPWYRVPNVYRPDALLTYMSGHAPRLVANDAKVFAPNTLHVIRLKQHSVTARALSVLWQTSLARLSAQVEGHAMGGGMLKLEPREAQRVLLPAVHDLAAVDAVAEEIDKLLRDGRDMDAGRLADEATLIRQGVTRRECERLSKAAALLVEKRVR